jgi:hypothetical protein
MNVTVDASLGSAQLPHQTPPMVSHVDNFGGRSRCMHVGECSMLSLCRACACECRGIRFMYVGARGQGVMGVRKLVLG